MRSVSILSAGLFLLGSATAQDTGSVNTATITDATAQPETPTTVPAVSTAIASNIPLQTTISNPVTATAPGAQIQTTAGAPSVTTDDLTTDIVSPNTISVLSLMLVRSNPRLSLLLLLKICSCVSQVIIQLPYSRVRQLFQPHHSVYRQITKVPLVYLSPRTTSTAISLLATRLNQRMSCLTRSIGGKVLVSAHGTLIARNTSSVLMIQRAHRVLTTITLLSVIVRSGSRLLRWTHHRQCQLPRLTTSLLISPSRQAADLAP